MVKDKSKEKEPEKPGKVVVINLQETNITKALLRYLGEKKENPMGVGSAIGYMNALIDSSVKDEKAREQAHKNFGAILAEHFWAGVFLAKTTPEKVRVSYQALQKGKEEEKEPMSYLG